MTDLQRSVLAISIALVLLLAALIIRTAGTQAEKVPVHAAKLFFKASSAHEYARTLATSFPTRAMGSENGRAAAQWLEAEMKKLGLRTETQELTVWIAGKRTVGQNVVGVLDGQLDDALLVIAHYDIPFHVREGAMDDASGVGVLLELARIFSRDKPKKTLIFVASDGEEWGMLGARHFVKVFPGLRKIRAVLSLDCAGLEKPERVSINGEGQFRGYAPLWLWLLAEDCISTVGGQPKSPSPIMQYLSQAVNISGTDQGPFLRAGISAINLGGELDSPLAHKVYHTTMDTSDNLRPELFDYYGKAAELMIRSLNVLGSIPDSSPYYMWAGERTYIDRTALFVLQAFFFLPLLLATSFQYYSLRKRARFLREVLSELANFGLFLVPWFASLGALYVLVWQNIIPKYELYPATPLDPFLYAPHWWAIAIIGATFALAWAAVSIARYSLALWGNPDFAASKAVCLDALLTISIIALIFNGFAATLFLAAPALMWIWIEQGRRPKKLIPNFLLVVLGALPFALLCVMLAQRLALGPYVPWYLLLGTGYGFFSLQAVLLAIGAATVGGRLLQKSLSRIQTPPEMQRDISGD